VMTATGMSVSLVDECSVVFMSAILEVEVNLKSNGG
jgi:hypothetical protein